MNADYSSQRGALVVVFIGIALTVILPIDPDKSYEITYQINGDESGPVIETISLTNGTSMEYYPSSLSTASSRTKITGKVTDVAETN
ncbi:hypothetical protein [Streptomyces sp. NPDC005969]|uniref:hypothetical protein n=1 Tax=Streptomyces sp. NPDC005969 TaxID=3156722 RepID=UPI0033E9B9FA